MNITININAPELAEAINALATALSSTGVMAKSELAVTKEEPKVETSPANEAPTQKDPEPEPEPEKPTITLETVRAKLGALSQNGKQKEVKDLITSFGVKKLTEMPKDKYAALLEAAEAL